MVTNDKNPFYPTTGTRVDTTTRVSKPTTKQTGQQPGYGDTAPAIKAGVRYDSDGFTNSALDFSQRPDTTSGGTSITVAQQAGSADPSRKVVVLDGGDHGQTVQSVVGDKLSKQSISFKQDDLPNAEFTTLDKFIDDGLSLALEKKAGDIKSIVQENGDQVGAINVSSGFNKALLLQGVVNLMNEHPDISKQVVSELGLGPNASSNQIVKALTNKIESKAASSGRFKQAQASFQSAVNFAAQNRTAVVVAAGNENKLVQEAQGIVGNLDNDFATNFYSMANNVVTVGATDDKGTADRSDDRAAGFSTRTDRVTVAANGTNVGGRKGVNGTSFSAPQVAGLMDIMLSSNSKLKVDQAINILKSTATRNGQIGNRVEGAGVVNWQAAIDQAQKFGGDGSGNAESQASVDESAG